MTIFSYLLSCPFLADDACLCRHDDGVIGKGLLIATVCALLIVLRPEGLISGHVSGVWSGEWLSICFKTLRASPIAQR